MRYRIVDGSHDGQYLDQNEAREHGYGETVVDGQLYLAALDIVTEYSLDGMRLTRPHMFEPVNVCEHCHRFDVRDVVCHSFAGAIDKGWYIRVEKAP